MKAVNETFADKLAKEIADAIMAAGNGPTPCQRIQFKGGTYPDNETDQGGFCRESLAKCILKTLQRHT